MTYIKHMEFVEVEDSISEPKKTFLQFVDVVDMVDKDGNPWDPTNPPDPDTYCTDLIKSVSLTSSANTSQVWSTNGGDLSDPLNAYNGTQDDGGTLSDAQTVKTFLQNQSIPNVSSLSVAAGTGGEMEFFVNDVSVGTYSDATASGKDFNKTFTFAPVTLNKLSVKGPNSVIIVYGVKVNGRLLVDTSVWNTSQNWSSTITGLYDDRGYEPTNAFNGDTSGNGWVPYGTPPSVWTPETAITGITSFRIRGQRMANAGNTVKVTQTDGSVVDISQQIGTTPGMNTITGVTSIKSMEFTGVNYSTDFIRFWAFEINGAILVDSNASTVLTFPTAENFDLFKVGDVVQTSDDNSQVIAPYDSRANTDQVWSAGIAGNAGSTQPTQGFNGNTTNSVLAVSTTSALEWTPPATGYTKLEIKCREDGIAPQVGDGAITVSGTGITTTVIPGPQVSDTFVNIPLTGSPVGTLSFLGTLDKVTAGICEVKLDGRILVDKGFWNASQNWSGLPLTGTVDPTYPLANVFNGSITDYEDGSRAVEGGALTLDFSGLSKTVGDVTLYVQQYGTANLSVNGVAITRVLGGGVQNYTVSVNGLLNNVSWEYIDGVNYNYLLGIYLDGELLVDSGAQWDISQVWSADATSNWSPSNSASNAFDGDIDSTRGLCDVKGETSTVTFNALSISSSLRVMVDSGATQPELLYINGNLTTGLSYPTGKGWVTIPGISSLTSIGVGRDNTGTYGDYTGIYAVEADGVILVNEGPNTSQLWSAAVTEGSIFRDSYPPEKAFNGIMSFTDSAATSGVADGSFFEFDWSSNPITYTQSVGIVWEKNGAENMIVSVTDSAGNVSIIDKTQNYGYDKWNAIPVDVSGLNGTIAKLKVDKNGDLGSSYLGGVYIDGRLLIDPSNIYSITDIDAAGPTINVDGGSWLGTDGSGEAGGQTKLCVTVTGPGPWDELVIAENGGANWVGSNVYEIGQTIEGKTAKFIGGLEPIIYRSRFQFQPAGGDTWVNKPWVDTTNDKNSMFYELTAPGKIKLQSQAKDSSEVAVYKPIYSNTSEKVIPYTEIGTVTVNPDQAAVNVMGNATFTAVVTGGDATDLTYKWTVRSGNAQLDTPDNQASATYTFIREGSTQIQCNVSSSNSSNSPQTNLSFVLVS